MASVAPESTAPPSRPTAHTGAELTPFDVSLVEQELCASADAFLPSALSVRMGTQTLSSIRDSHSSLHCRLPAHFQTWSSNVKLDRAARNRPSLPEIDRPYNRRREGMRQAAGGTAMMRGGVT